MLEDDYQNKLDYLLSTLTCEVKIPEEWSDYFSRTGVCPTNPDERRRFQRQFCRAEAILEVDKSLPVIERQHSLFAVYTKDVSRGSIAFLHTAQLYPGEECFLWLPARKRSITITRCSRHNDKCFSIGAVLGGA